MKARVNAGMDAGTAAPWQQYICEVCGLVYDEAQGDPDGGLPPGTRYADIPDDWACPVCGVGKADFVPHPAPTPGGGARAKAGPVLPPRRRSGDAGVLIVGAGRAGWQVAQALRERDAALPITLLSACAADVYDKPQLSVAVARGISLDRLVRETAGAAARRLNLRLLAHTAAVHVDLHTRSLRTTRGSLRWRQLVLAHGAEPALPAELPADRVWRVNDLAAYSRLRQALASGPQRLALVGAGLLGCELANDLALAGHAITLLDRNSRPLAAQLPPQASARLLAAWGSLPIRFVGGVRVTGVERLPTGALRIHTQAGPADTVPAIEVDQVIAATGLRTPSRLARSAGLVYDHAAGGIVTDATTGTTSQPGIYALGDCAVVDGRASRHIEPIARQAQAIAAAICGQAPPTEVMLPPSEPVLRVKTSALPITLKGRLEVGDSGVRRGGDDGRRWTVDSDDPSALRMRHVGADGRTLVTLSADTA